MPLSVYVVDDAANVRERLGRLFNSIEGIRTAGYAARADTAIEGILAAKPDVVVLDIALAHGTGFEVLRAIRERAPGIDAYVLSNSATPPYRQLAAELGARDLFDKSLEFDVLRDALRQRACRR
jgi:DNA-binding NarL/FixJ family response regulator